MMNNTADIPFGKVTAHIVADLIQLPKQKTPYRAFHNASGRAGNCVVRSANRATSRA